VPAGMSSRHQHSCWPQLAPSDVTAANAASNSGVRALSKAIRNSACRGKKRGGGQLTVSCAGGTTQKGEGQTAVALAAAATVARHYCSVCSKSRVFHKSRLTETSE
jgi:hypothetical protein